MANLRGMERSEEEYVSTPHGQDDRFIANDNIDNVSDTLLRFTHNKNPPDLYLSTKGNCGLWYLIV